MSDANIFGYTIPLSFKDVMNLVNCMKFVFVMKIANRYYYWQPYLDHTKADTRGTALSQLCWELHLSNTRTYQTCFCKTNLMEKIDNVNMTLIHTGSILLYTTVRAYIIYEIVYLIVQFHVRSVTLSLLTLLMHARFILRERFMTNI